MTKRDAIPYPSEQEIEKQISHILKKSLPTQKTFFNEMKSLFQQVGWRYLLPNRNEWIFTIIAIVALSIFMFVTVNTKNELSESQYAVLFMFSPFLFASLSLYSFIEKRESATFELEMTTKFTVFQLIAIRMLTYSGLAIFINTSIVLVLANRLQLNFLHVWLLSLAGLFLFAAGLLFVMNAGNLLVKTITYICGWISLNCALVFYAKSAYVQLISSLPNIIYVCVVLVLFAISSIAFKRMYLQRQEGITVC